MHDTFWTLLQDSAHWEFEIFLMLLFDGVIAGLCWPFARKHWQHHVDRDKQGTMWFDANHNWTDVGPLSDWSLGSLEHVKDPPADSERKTGRLQ
jgi:hypothetical protein